MPKPVKAPIRAKRPRAEVQQEFSAIREEAEAAKQIADPKREESLRQQEAEIRAAVDGISVEGVVRNMSGLSLEISKALGGLSDKLVEEVNRLASVRQAVELEQKELQRLHKIDIGHGARPARSGLSVRERAPGSRDRRTARGLGRGIATKRARAQGERR